MAVIALVWLLAGPFLLAWYAFGAEGGSGGLPIDPDPKIQLQIQHTTEALEKVHDGYIGVERAFAEMKVLKELSSGDNVCLVRQLAYYMATGRGEKQTVLPLVLFDLMEISEHARVAALAPYLDAQHRGLSSIANRVLRGIDKTPKSWARRPLDPVNYRIYRDYVAGHLSRSEPIPEPFVRYIYRRRPGHGFLAFLFAHEGSNPKQRDLLWAEHVVSDVIWRKENGFESDFESLRPEAIRQLDRLSRHDAWWVRLYVGEIVARYREFQTPEILERLRKDPSSLVRQVAHKGAEEAETQTQQDPISPAEEAAGDVDVEQSPISPAPVVELDALPPPNDDSSELHD